MHHMSQFFKRVRRHQPSWPVRSPCPFLWQFLFVCVLLLHRNISQASTGTGLSGFGARSMRKTIFPVNNATTSKLPKAASAFFSQDLKLVTDRPKLWVRKQPYIESSPQTNQANDALWIQLRDDGDHSTTTTLRMTVSQSTGDWTVAERQYPTPDDANDTDGWIPIEGLYGFYKVPSGIVCVLVTKTEPVYTAPPIEGQLDDHQESIPWWTIRKVSNMEMVHVSHPDTTLSTAHLKEEVRQLRLLRHSLKEHGFYFVPTGESRVVTDMTCNLQKSLQLHVAKASDSDGKHSPWWACVEDRPDSRFFWNEVAVQSLLQRFDSEKSSLGQRRRAALLLEHVIPLTSAFVGIQPNITDSKSGLQYDQLLISRRSRFRAGTRFTRRGADASGAVANFAETEQICLILDKHHNATDENAATPSVPTVKQVMSHIQTRGSIPLRWSSPADVKTYRPRVRIGIDPLAQARALRLHLLEQFAHYVTPVKKLESKDQPRSNIVAKLVFLNLIDKKKDQGRLGRAFEAVLRAVMDVYSEDKEIAGENAQPILYDLHSPSSPKNSLHSEEEEMLSDVSSVKHVWFDFHAEVKDGRWDRLSGLLGDFQASLNDHGYFLADSPRPATENRWKIQSAQTAIIRTNCMDCLDRTNVVQSLFGRYILFQQLAASMTECQLDKKRSTWDAYLKKYGANSMSIPWVTGEKAHRMLWADNADAISRLYAGTAALKGDFTRTGKRTKKGALDDGMNSLQRYYLNNFQDSDRQEGMDLLVGYTQFSNAEFLEDDTNIAAQSTVEAENMCEASSLSRDGDETTLFSFREAARQSFLGNMVDHMSGSYTSDSHRQIEIVGGGARSKEAEERQPFDLRWLPGDLQSHVISHAGSNPGASGAIVSVSAMPGFSSAKALAAIDHRSTSDLPWWVPEADEGKQPDFSPGIFHTSKSEDEHEQNQVESSAREVVDLSLTDHQRYPRVSRERLLGLLIAGVRAPVSLATFVVGLLSCIFIPSILQSEE